MKATRSTPLARRAASVQSRMRRSPTSAKHLGVSAVVGISRLPRPAPMMMACILLPGRHVVLEPLGQIDFGHLEFQFSIRCFFGKPNRLIARVIKQVRASCGGQGAD